MNGIAFVVRALSTIVAITASGSEYEFSAYDGRRNRLTLKVLKGHLSHEASPRRGEIKMTDAREGFTVREVTITPAEKLLVTINPYPNGWAGTPEDHSQESITFITSRLANLNEVREWMKGLS